MGEASGKQFGKAQVMTRTLPIGQKSLICNIFLAGSKLGKLCEIPYTNLANWGRGFESHRPLQIP
jgi:hypothetical protein